MSNISSFYGCGDLYVCLFWFKGGLIIRANYPPRQYGITCSLCRLNYDV